MVAVGTRGAPLPIPPARQWPIRKNTSCVKFTNTGEVPCKFSSIRYRKNKRNDIVHALYSHPSYRTNGITFPRCYTILSTYSMELNTSWEAASCSPTLFTNVLWNPKVRYRVNKSPSLDPTLSQTNPVHTTSSYLSQIHLNIILQPTSWSVLDIIIAFSYGGCLNVPRSLEPWDHLPWCFATARLLQSLSENYKNGDVERGEPMGGDEILNRTLISVSRDWTHYFRCTNIYLSRSQWPRGLRHELFSIALRLGFWVRIPFQAWMSLCVYSVFVLGSGLATGWSPIQWVLPTVLGLRNWSETKRVTDVLCSNGSKREKREK
jgi:hypothetical protein